MAELSNRDEGPIHVNTDQVTAAGAVLVITALVIGIVGLILVTLGQFYAVVLLLLAVGLWALGRRRLRHASMTPPTASPPSR
jgi:hypothetical protein